ncbi:Gfo/Idh/MocA family oxidoreductase [Candidatus Sumerlaeota bacterium]|nr:Gfo/Idh/MocA family oxidoreductase [Candidatus Sumerlaeota bacterium]
MSKKVCVVGAGRWGRNHIQTLHTMDCLGGIVEANDETLARLAQSYPEAKTFPNVRDAVREEFDGFTVATPAATHFEIASFLLRDKKHVLVEKPIALKASEARELDALARRQGVQLMVGHVLLFHPAIAKIKELVDAGKIGKLEYLYSNRLNLGAVRTEENILWSFAPHDISIFQHLIGAMPTQVTSRGGAFLQPHIHDTTMTVLSYPDNVVGHIFVSWLHPFKEHRLVAIGSKGMLSFDDSSESKDLLFHEKGIDWVQGEPVKRDGATEAIPYDRTLPLTNELTYFVDCLGGNPVELADGRSAVEVLEILEQATVSLLAGSPVAPQPSKDYFVHKSAYVDEGAEVGAGTKIWHFSHVMKGARIGERCILGQNCNVDGGALIGNNVKVQNNVSIYAGAVIEDDVFLGPSCVLTNVTNPRSQVVRHSLYEKTTIRRGASIGANATIVCGVEIGRYAFIAAGAVVAKNVPDYALMVGVPARQTGWMSRHGLPLQNPDAEGVMTCPESGYRYKEAVPGVLRCLDLDEEAPLPEDLAIGKRPYDSFK